MSQGFSGRFVETGGMQSYAPPFLLEDTRLNGFLVRVADLDALQRTCDHWLNDFRGETDSVYRVLGDLVLVAHAPIGRISCVDSPDTRMGYTPETDVAFWIPVGRCRKQGDAWVLEQVAWFLPYVWVDVPTTMVTGREVYGFAKQFGWLPAPQPEESMRLETLVLPTLDPNTELSRRPMLSVLRGAEQPTAEALIDDTESFLEEMVKLWFSSDGRLVLPGLEFTASLISKVIKAEIPMLFLKQFRDAEHPEAACYQALVEAPARLVNFHSGRLVTEKRGLRIWSYESHPVLKDLGLLPEGQIPPPGGFADLESEISFELNFDFRLETGKVVGTPGPSPVPQKKRKIAILGGGVGAMTTAYYLTEKSGWQDEYEITLYQLGWRVGGKGASGRHHDPKYGHRIEEHGLHIWLGFYENAFRTMRQVFRQLGELGNPPVKTFRTWQDAFKPHSLVTLEENVDGEWIHWPLLFPTTSETPGETGEIDWWGAVEITLEWMTEWWRVLFTGDHGSEPLVHKKKEKSVARSSFLGKIFALPEAALASVVRATGDLMPLDRALEDVRKQAHDRNRITPAVQKGIAKLIRLALEGIYAIWDDYMDVTPVRRLFIGLDLAGTCLVGLLEQDLINRGFDAADDRDWMEWLRHFGAKEVTVNSAPVRTIYDLVFGFAAGNTQRPDFAAGTALRGTIRMLITYKGALMYEMQAGMGDTIFTPLYGLLKDRGVKFEFFHKVDKVLLDPLDKQRIGRIEMTRQVNLKPEVIAKGGYDPLVRVNELDCWPDQPNWDQIADADQLANDPDNPGQPYNLESYWSRWKGVGKVQLEVGKDFDEVVMGISIGALPSLCPELIAHNPDWKRMVEGVRTTQTQAVQLWLAPTSDQLGFPTPDWAREAEAEVEEPGLGISPLVGGYVQDLDTWADLGHLLKQEPWPASQLPGSIAYLCGPLREFEGPHPFDDHKFPSRALATMKASALTWFRNASSHLWPNGATRSLPYGLNPNLLVDPENRADMERFDAQFFRVNIDPSERYVLSVRGSTSLRLWPDRSGFSNLVLAGDWTRNPVLDAGCVEAAVASGMLAAFHLRKEGGNIVG